ncbi:MAG: BLUF domain-containing protein [Paracoccaceae bacterium]|jgi:hypothetical protein|nr:BLUF domain-containing protein [Paracoccaceae bacterium]
MPTILVYASRRLDESADNLARIEATSARENACDGLTGALLHDSRVFLQMLEGEHDAVARCFLRIAVSPLHADIRVVSLATRAARLYGDWSMRVVSAEGREPGLAARVRRLRALPREERAAEADRVFLTLCD